MSTGSDAPSPRLILVTGSLGAGGAERVLSGMAGYWAQKGWSVTFATWDGGEQDDFYALHSSVARVHLADVRDRGMRRVWRAVRRLRALIRTQRPDAVLSFISTSNVLTLLASAGLASRVVVSERIEPAMDRTISRSWRIARALAYRFADVVVAQTQSAADWLRRHCGCDAVVIPNPLRALPEPALDREPLVVGIGRLVPQKGFDLLLDAFAMVHGSFPGWRLCLVGDGAERARLEALAAGLGIGDAVTFAGRVRDVETWIARAGLVVAPSRFEGFPNVVLESMGLGAAVISADCPSGPAELIENGVNGRLVPAEDVAALAAAMRELMHDPDRRAALGAAARAVRTRFREDRIMARWEACLAPAGGGVVAQPGHKEGVNH